MGASEPKVQVLSRFTASLLPKLEQETEICHFSEFSKNSHPQTAHNRRSKGVPHLWEFSFGKAHFCAHTGQREVTTENDTLLNVTKIYYFRICLY